MKYKRIEKDYTKIFLIIIAEYERHGKYVGGKRKSDMTENKCGFI
jgi:hypothetical protein